MSGTLFHVADCKNRTESVGSRLLFAGSAVLSNGKVGGTLGICAVDGEL